MSTDSRSSDSVLTNNTKYEGRQSTNESRSNQSVNTYEKCQRIAPKAVFEAVKNGAAMKTVISKIYDDAINSPYLTHEIVAPINSVEKNQLCALLYYILTEFLHLIEVTTLQRRILGNIVVYLTEENYITTQHFKLAYENSLGDVEELQTDVPKIWQYIFDFIGNYLNIVFKYSNILFQIFHFIY